MKIIIQRVLRGQVSVDSQVVSQIGKGVMILCGITHTDNILDVDYLTNKVLKLRLWPDA